MSIYTTHVFDDQLISPINGYICKRITKQNIRQFGFETVEDLHEIFPDFPLICKDVLDKVRSGGKSDKKKKYEENIKLKNRLLKDEIEQKERLIYLQSPRYCAKCSSAIDFDKRHWKHCSRKCANSRKWSEEDKKIKSIAAKKSERKSIADKQRRNSKLRKRKNVEYFQTNCSICNTSLELTMGRKTKTGIYSCSDKNCKTKATKMAQVESGKRSAAKRCKRSKQEIELYNLLEQHFQNIGNNDPIANGWDADILLYDHKIAILWNGPWHYREMGFSNHSLKQVVNRDCIKIQEFENIEWKVLIYQDNQWTPEEAMIDILIQV